jgi:hypothetical protein
VKHPADPKHGDDNFAVSALEVNPPQDAISKHSGPANASSFEERLAILLMLCIR